jgi:PAS domain S-box-containing protein
MEKDYRVLLVEDLVSDVELANHEISKVLDHYVLKVVETETDFIAALKDFKPHIVVSDFRLPSFDGLRALKIVLKESPVTPVIILTGSMNEDTAVKCMKAGANDYVIKEHIKRLGQAMLNALEQRDIRLQKNDALNLLKQNEAKYRYMFANNPQPMWIYDIETLELLEVNEAAVKHYGYSREDFLSMTLKDLRPADDIPALLKDVEITKKTYNPAGEWRHIKKNGDQIYVEIVSHTVNFNGRRARHVMITDITERRNAQLALKLSEEKYRAIFENVQDVFYQTTIDGIITEISPSVKFFSEFVREELIGNQVSDLYADPGDRKKLLDAINKNGEIRDYPLRLITKSGVIKYTSINARLMYDEYNKPDHINGAIRDVTKRTIAESRLRLLSRAVEQSMASIIITDSEGRFEYVNPAFSLLTGYSFDEVKGKTPRILKSGLQTAGFYKDLWDTILSGSNWQGEMQNRKKNGDLYWENVIISPLTGNEGKVEHFISVKEDISEKMELIDNLTIAKEKAEESDRLKTSFLQNISHEIRTPMNGIIGFAALLSEPGFGDEEKNSFIGSIQKSSDQLLSIISDILDISSVLAKVTKSKFSEVDLHSALKSIIGRYVQKASEKNTILSFRPGLPSEDSIIMTDSSKVERIFSNLISNAIKFTSGGEIVVGCELKDHNIELYVSDTGIGIPPEFHSKIFENFYQVEHSLTRLQEGTGLGLPLSKAFAEHLGGTIRVDSEPGKGSTFYLTLPYVKPVAREENHVNESESKPKILSGKNNILVAEDDVNNFKLIESYLTCPDVSVFHAKDGIEALDIFNSQGNIDMILMDIKMPNMDGLTAARQIRKINSDVVIILQSAYDIDMDAAVNYGCNDFISKPFKKEQLLYKVKEHLGVK